ncbi:hypothetical protein BCR35DRAFT_120502 [Leucosporidium creatinivorum]|uniref:JmjC domain-containing protein n=1 Tax=Leucosporidium creatinivorum TaxID=106004 RepID=A0A1Y2EZ42_9BASI|nr:hypothetical protein BCR35DRAFT_120502 [Leucosporidium creatinivorum]
MIDQPELPTELLSLLSHLCSTQSDLNLCGPAVLHQLSLISTLLCSPPSNLTNDKPRAKAHHLSLSLLRLADEKILAYHYSDVPLWWRRLYTDASLLGVIALLLASAEEKGKEGAEKEQWKEAVRLLDMVLIVAGAPGMGREDLVFTLLSHVQAHLSSSSSPSRPTKRPRPSPPSPSPLPSPHVTHSLPRFTIETAPSLTTYLTTPTLLSGPFIITGGCLSWPATEPGRWDTADYLLAKAGEGRVVPVEVGGDYTREGWGQRIVPFSDFLSSLSPSSDDDGEEEEEEEEPLYLAQHNLFRQFPSLVSDILLPDYIYSSPPPPAEVPSYRPPANEEGYVVNAWLGPKGTVSRAHTDGVFNCFAQILGSKWLWVAPPSCSPWMYPYGSNPSSTTIDNNVTSTDSEPREESEDTDGGAAAAGEEAQDEGGSTNHLLTNTSRLPVHLHVPSPSPSSPSSPSSSRAEPSPPSPNPSPSPLDAFPGFKTHVEPFAMQTVLERGDLLVMPPG